MTGTRTAARMTPPASLLSLLALVALVAGCSGAEGPAGDAPTAAASERRPPKPLRLAPWHNETFGGSRLDGCASMADHVYEHQFYGRPLLVWVRLRATEPLRLLPATYAGRSHAIDSVRQYLGPDPGPRAPNLAVSIARAGEGPTAERLDYDTQLIGDTRHSAAGVAAAQASWAARVPLKKGVPVSPGDRYLFVEIDPAPGGMDIHGLTVRWTRDGKPGHQLIGELSARVLCGG